MSQTYFEEVELGDELGPLLKEPTREQVLAYVSPSTYLAPSASVDTPELRSSRFTSDEAAQSEGIRGIIVPGNMSMCFLSQLLDDWAGDQGWLTKLRVNFRRMVEPGDKLECKAIVTDMQVVDGRNLVTLDAYIENQKGERPIQGTAEVVLPSRE